MAAPTDPSHPENVQEERVAIVSDAHLLAPQNGRSDEAFRDFLLAVPGFADRLILNGDTFDFWFEYRSVIPRRTFPWLAALSTVREAGVHITMTGGNHDRWGAKFWPEQMDIPFHAEGFETSLAGYRAFVHHGDGLSEDRWTAAILHKITRNPLTIGAFRLLHPDFGYWLVTRGYNTVRKGPSDQKQREIVAAQTALGRSMLAERPELDLVVLSHVHEAVLEEVGERRWFLNPGAWQEHLAYAVVTAKGPELRTWT